MNRFIHFGIGAVLLVLVCLTSCRGDGPTSAKPITTSEAPETTETATAVCDALKTNKTCCSNTACSWIVCLNTTEKVNHTGCHDLSNSTDKQNAAADCNVTVDVIDQSDTCPHSTPTTPPKTTSTTTASTSTTSAQTTSTAEPTTTQLPVPGSCEGITKKEECCGTQGLKLKCQYVNCTTTDKKSTTPLCLNSTKIASKCTPESHVICNSNQTSTTQAPTTSAPTKAPPTTPAPHTGTTPHGQHFDGASFFGGMILMAGLFIIAFFAIKFYRARKDRSYRTL